MVTHSKIEIHPDLINFVRPTPHSKFSPSAGERWYIPEDGTGCSYSIQASKDIPEEKSLYADEGTLAHSVCEAVIRSHFYMMPFPKDLNMKRLLWEKDHPGSMQEMNECAQTYLDVAIFWLNNKDQIGEVLYWGVERGIPQFPEKGAFGTADLLIIGTKGCAMIDYKHGKGKNVAPNTIQLRIYLAGVYKYLRGIDASYKFFSVICQPRTDIAPKVWEYTTHEIAQTLDRIWYSILQAERTDLQPNEGNWCFWCPAKRTKVPELKCKLIADKPVALAKESFAKFLGDMSHRTEKMGVSNPVRDEAMMKIMALYPLVKDIAESAKAEFISRISRGENIDGVRIVEELGNRTINALDDNHAADLIAALGVTPWVEVPATKKLVTLKQIEKNLGKDKDKLNSICVKKITKRVDVLDEKMRTILGDLAAYGTMVTNGNNQEE